MELIDKFGGDHAEAYNALHTALVECAEDDNRHGEYKEYDWLENCPRTTLIVFLVDKLQEMGYDIVKTTYFTASKED